MSTMILIDPYHDGFLERYNSLVSLYASFNSGNSFPRFLLYGSDIWGMFNPFTMKCKKENPSFDNIYFGSL
jgi:hypothetical protein